MMDHYGGSARIVLGRYNLIYYTGPCIIQYVEVRTLVAQGT